MNPKIKYTTILVCLIALFSAPNCFAQNPGKIKPSGMGADQFQKFDDEPFKFRHYGKPGETIKSNITIHNNESEPIIFYLDAVDEVVNEKGEKSYELSTDQKDGISQYYKFPQKTITVPAKYSQVIPYLINIPSNYPEKEYRSGITILKENPAVSGSPLRTNVRIVLSNSTFISNNAQPPKLFSWRNLPFTYIYLTTSSLLLLLYLVYLHAEKKKKRLI